MPQSATVESADRTEIAYRQGGNGPPLILIHGGGLSGQSDHGLQFKLLAESVDAPIHCQSFTNGRLRISCGEGCEDYRSKASKLVKHPETVRCRPHDASMTVEHVATGRTWTDNEGYERQRAAIEAATDAEW